MQIKWLTKALQNLNDEADYIAQEDPAAARKIVAQIFAAADNPGMGHPGRIHGTRELVIADTRYIVPYRVRPALQQIEILRAFHSSRRLPKRW